MNRVVLGLLSSFFGIAGITFVGLGTLFFFDDMGDEQLFGTWFGFEAPFQMWQTGGIFMIVCLLALIAHILAFPEESPSATDEDFDS